jgi:hypothetical protein
MKAEAELANLYHQREIARERDPNANAELSMEKRTGDEKKSRHSRRLEV